MDDGLAWLAAVWIAYFALHSVLASLTVKNRVAGRWPGIAPLYRLLYNTVAVLLLVPPLYMIYTMQGAPLWQWQGVAGWVADGIAAGAVIGFFWTLRYYDGAAFLGIRQWRHGAAKFVGDDDNLTISPLHRFVRHPWYFLALLIIWTRDMDPAFLVTSVVITGYFVVGSRLEERKLVAWYGDAYREYIARVPGLLPLPWKYLTPAAARALEIAARNR